MSGYNYGPPPPAPPPAAPTNGPGGYAGYGQPYQQGAQRGGHAGRGRGGPDRGGYHQPAPAYGYNPQPAPYGQQPAAPYPSPHPAYPAQPQPQQSWHTGHAQHPPQHAPSHSPLPAQNYHPNYAPHVYHQQPQPQPQPFAGQPAYPPAQQHYAGGYPVQTPQQGPDAAQQQSSWGAHPQPPSQNQYSGGGRGGRGHNDRGAPRGQLMGPPIRLGFDNSPPPAPVSTPYPSQPYGAPQGAAGPYPPAPYQAYPTPAPYMPPAAPYDNHSGHNSRYRGGGRFHNQNTKPRSQPGNDRSNHRNRGQANQTPPANHQKPDGASSGKKKKRKTNTLGLTPGDESDDYEENEEELEQMYGADAPKPTDIAAWIAERRAKFPTKARIDAKKAAEVAAKAQNGDAKGADGRSAQNDEKQRQLELKAEKLRKELEKVESNIKRKREQQDEGDDMRDIDMSPSATSGSKSDDDKPEAMSTRQESNNVPPPPKKADPKKHCKYYSTGGTCGKRGKCRFVHDPAVREEALKARELNGGRMTLQQRLALNDKDQEDLTIVQTLKYLQDKGVFTKDVTSAPPSDAAASNAQQEQGASRLPPPPVKQEASGTHGLPPIPPASVVANGQTSKYTGWNLSGFGNTGVQSGDA